MANVNLKHAASVEAARIHGGAGAVVNWNGIDYPCQCSSEMREDVLGLGGFNDQPTRTAVLGAAQFGPTLPQSKQTLFLVSGPGAPSVPYRIQIVEEIAGGQMLRLHLYSPTQGA